jgi:hypothetical protein
MELVQVVPTVFLLTSAKYFDNGVISVWTKTFKYLIMSAVIS